VQYHVVSLREGVEQLSQWGHVQGGQPPGKAGKVEEFDISQGKVGEIVVYLSCATAVAIVTK